MNSCVYCKHIYKSYDPDLYHCMNRCVGEEGIETEHMDLRKDYPGDPKLWVGYYKEYGEYAYGIRMFIRAQEHLRPGRSEVWYDIHICEESRENQCPHFEQKKWPLYLPTAIAEAFEGVPCGIQALIFAIIMTSVPALIVCYINGGWPK